MKRKPPAAAKRFAPTAGFGVTPRPPRDAIADLFASAVAQHQNGALAAAERGYRQVLAALPDHADAHSRLGAILMRQGKSREAVRHMERAVALWPASFEAHGNLAQAYTWLGQRENAIEAATRALELRETA